MRAKILGLLCVASALLVAQAASSETADEKWRLMEQRMAEMEDRLAATSSKLEAAETKLDERDATLVEHGLLEVDDEGLRSGVGSFFEMVDISGVVAASYNHRVLDGGDDRIASSSNSTANPGGNVGLFRHPDSNTFALDQVWLIVDKAVTEESRGGMHFEAYTGKTKAAQNGGSEFGFEVYTAYASYLAPIGNGVQVDAGLLATPLGAEVIQTNQNFNITTGLVFGLQPVTHTGIAFSTQLTDEIGFVAGVVNDVYSNQNFDVSNGKAGYAQISYAGDAFGLNVGAIVGSSEGAGGCAFTDADDECNTSVFDVVASMSPTDNIDLWANFDWVHVFGDSAVDGDAYGVSGAGRIGITDRTGIATRVEYVRAESSFNSGPADTPGDTGSLTEILSLTGTIDHALTDSLKVRAEARWDRKLDDGSGGIFFNGQNGAGNTFASALSNDREDQLVLLGEMYFEF